MRGGWYEEGWYVAGARMSLLEAIPVYICVFLAKEVCSVTEHCGT